MVLEADVEDRSGRLLLRAGAIVTGDHLRLFRTWGIVEVNIAGSDGDEGISSPIAEVDPELFNVIEVEMRPRFLHADLDHPAMQELLRLCILEKVRHELS